MELHSLDFQQARIKLVLFKSRLRSVLYGVREADEELRSVYRTPLGQWLRTTGARYAIYPEIREIERALEAMIGVGEELIGRFERGYIEEARAGLSLIEEHAGQIETLLQRLEGRAGLTGNRLE